MTIIDTLSDVSSSDTDDRSSDPSKAITPIDSPATRIRHRTRKRKKTRPQIGDDPTLLKYWNRRYDLFERFDSGVQLDKESWYSVTPECIARQQATACACDFLVDAFAGVGGNTIQFARTCSLVLSIDNNYTRLLLLKHNAQVYGVSNNIMPICGDVVSILRALRQIPVPSHDVSEDTGSTQPSPSTTPSASKNESASELGNTHISPIRSPLPTLVDCIFLSPPWGGPGYTGVVLPPGSSSWNVRKRRQWFQSSGDAIEPTKNLEEVPHLLPTLQAARHICHRILAYLPRSCSIGQMLQLAWPSNECTCQMCCQSRTVSLEEYLVRGRRVAVGVHIGRTVE